MTVLSVVGLFLLVVSTAVTKNVVELSDATPPMILDKIDKPAGYIRSCRETSYTGKVIVNSSRLFETACIQGHRLFGDGWMVMQQRLGSAEILMKSWAKYRGGFGSVDAMFWAGLENIYQLTKTTPHELVVEFVKSGGEYSYGRYERFEIDKSC
ncbi:conserved hypothetical protein [Culex quinquefasciatus]|uniref:Fibrinogen C-terminal domain-containing protein n=1 Tax=Culex quinquefasciatus TaxID=7176 RepID=B0XJ57_CULQU|nr:conserved hypothetical protein [Culex quinquefasciatus]|eukprot:XP_001869679.1 conserved hypothetical protein [Culex quinquefasciatus]